MTLLIRKPADSRYLKLCVFAPAGAGKTVLLGSLEEDERTYPCLGLDFEGGTESLAGLDIDVAPIGSWQDFNEAYEKLASGDSGYKSCFIDSISEVHKFALLEILRQQGPTRKDKDLLEQRDYGTATVQMRRLLREFRDLPMHVVFSAHAKEVEIPREGRVRVPDLAGQMAEEVSGIVSVQGYLAQFTDEEGKNSRTLLLHSFPKFRIKCRTPWKVEAPEEIIDPTITDILDVLRYGDREVDLQSYADRGSSRDKELVEEDVKVDTDGTALPGKDENTKAVEARLDGHGDPNENEGIETPAPTREEIAGNEAHSPGADDPAPEPETPAAEASEPVEASSNGDGPELIDFARANLPQLRQWCTDNDPKILESAKTRRQILEAVRAKYPVAA